MAECCGHVKRVRNRRILQVNQIVLTERNPLVSLPQQLDEFARLVLAWGLFLYCKRILGFVKVCPVNGTVHHFRGQPLHEVLRAGKDVVLQECCNLGSAFNGGTIRKRSNTVELPPPARITFSDRKNTRLNSSQ